MRGNNNYAIIEHRTLLVSVKNTATDKSTRQKIYEAARYAWFVKIERVQRAEIVLAILHGVIVGAFVPDRWMEATARNFPGHEPDPGRYGFVGSFAKQDVWQRYVGRRLAQDNRLYGPIRYIGC